MARLAGHIPCEERQRAPPLPAFTAYKLEDSDGKDFPADEAKKSKKSLFTFSTDPFSNVILLRHF